MNYDIEKLLQIKIELNNLTEELNKRILEFEADLKKLEIGIPIWIKLTEDTKLGYTKYNGEWHITVQYKDGQEDKINSLVHATRGVRLYCLKHLYLLLPALETAANEFLEKMKKELE